MADTDRKGPEWRNHAVAQPAHSPSIVTDQRPSNKRLTFIRQIIVEWCVGSWIGGGHTLTLSVREERW